MRLLIVVILCGSLLVFADTASADFQACASGTGFGYGPCDSSARCNKDGWCSGQWCGDPAYPGGPTSSPFCVNKLCLCKTPLGSSPPPICSAGQQCPAQKLYGYQYDYPGSACPGGVHTDVIANYCRGAATASAGLDGDRGGVLSYCTLCSTCGGLNGKPCSKSNSCGSLTNYGTYNCTVCNAVQPPETCGATPTGIISGADCSLATGSAQDADFAGAVTVELYRDFPKGLGGVLVGTVSANSNWIWPVDASFQNGLAHKLYAIARNVDKFGAFVGSGDASLINSPYTMPLCDALPTASLPAATCGSATITASDSSGLPVPVQLVDGTIAGGGRVLVNTTVSGSKAVAWVPGITDGGTHTLHLYAQNVPSGGAYVDVATATVNCPLDPPVLTSALVTGDYCTSGAEVPAISVNWTTAANPQVKYQIIADDSILFALPWQYDSGIVTSAAKTGTIPQGKLTFGATYYVKVQAFGTSGIPSSWSNVSAPIVVPAAPAPIVALSVSPAKPIAKAEATFSDDTDYKGDTILTRTWDFGDGTVVTENAPIVGNTIKHTYLTEAAVTVMLTVQTVSMPVGQSCSATLPLGVSKAIPVIIEVRP